MATYERGPRISLRRKHRTRSEESLSNPKRVTRRSFLLTLLTAVTVGVRRSSESVPLESSPAQFGYGGVPLSDSTTRLTEAADEPQAYGAHGYGGVGHES